MMQRRQLLKSLVAASLFPAAAPHSPLRPRARPLLSLAGEPDWIAVRQLFPLAPDWTHLSSFLFVSHPKPVAEAIDHFRKKLDSDAMWIEIAAFTDAEGRPFAAVKRALAEYTGGSPSEIACTFNTTTALAMAYHGLRIRGDQEIHTTQHDHYSHHESISGSAAIRRSTRPSTITIRITSRSATPRRAITPATRAVGVTWVQSSTGIKLPIAHIAQAVARANRGAHCRIERRVPGWCGAHTGRHPAHAARPRFVGSVARLAEKKLRTTTSPYKVSYARVSAGIMNKPEEIDVVLREIKALT